MVSEKKLREMYWDWLLDKIEYKKIDLDEYSLLLKEMFRTNFIWFDDPSEIAMDENRAKDGKYLRCMFDLDSGYHIYDYFEDIGKDCSVLEMILALAIRIENEIMGYGTEEYGKWFWAMISNLGLKRYRNNAFDEVKVRRILNDFIWRKRECFLFKPGEKIYTKTYTNIHDFKNLEIWEQMSIWLNEKYGEKMGFL